MILGTQDDGAAVFFIWHLLADPAARYQDLGARYHASRLDTGKKVRNHIRQLERRGSVCENQYRADS
jgi:hypothetical protein